MPRLYDWLNDPQRNEKIFNSRLNDEFDNIIDDFPFYLASEYGVVADGTNQTTNLQAAFDAVAATGGALFLPPGVTRADGALLLDGNNISIVGNGSFLDLRHEGAHKLVIGNGTTLRQNIRFHDVNFVGPGTGTDATYLIEARYLSGLSFTGYIKMLAFHGFMKVGRAGDTGGVSQVFINGNVNAGHNLLSCGHFIDLVNCDGAFFITGNGSVEGDSPFAAGTSFLNVGTTATRPDGVQISGAWTVRRYDVAVNLRAGIGNMLISGVVFDGFLTAAVLADEVVGSINGLQIQNCHIGNYTLTSATAWGLNISGGRNVMIQGNRIFSCGADGIRIDGTGDVNIQGNSMNGVGQQADDTFSGVLISTNATGVVAGNVVYTGAANAHKYGVSNGSASANMVVYGNRSIGHGTALYSGTNEF